MFIVLTFIINRIRETFMNILGLNYIYHDSTECWVRDGRLIYRAGKGTAHTAET